MRIVHIIPSLIKGGAQRLCLDIVRALSKRKGLEVKLVILHDENTYQNEYSDIEPIVISSHVTPSITAKWSIDLTDWNALMDEFKPDVIHSHLFEAEIVSRQELREGVRYFTHCHDNMRQLRRASWTDLLSKTRLSELYERQHIIKQYKACDDRFLAISQDTFSYFSEVLPISLQPNITLLHNAIDTKKFSQKCATYDLRKPSIKLINIGWFVAKKNQSFLLDVIIELNKIGLNAELDLIGDGELIESVKQKAQENGIQAQVHFLGSLSNVENYLWESDIYVHSATYEPFGLVLVEAIAAGLPVVSLNGKGNVSLIRNGHNGFILDEPDPKEFADRIRSVVSSQEYWKTLSSNAKTSASEYDIDQYSDRLLELYSVK